MSRRMIDFLVTGIFAVLALLVTVLALAGGIVAVVHHFAGDGKMAAPTEESPCVLTDGVLSAPTGDSASDVWEDPDEPQRSLEAIMAKCQCVPDCYIVGYAPELVEGWRPEYKSDTGLYLTSSGMWAGLYHTVATDPEIIPTGATVIIDGDIYIAADTGVRGKVIDVMVDVETALTYGCHKADVWWCLEG